MWEPREIYALRVDHRLVGSLVGAISKAAHGRQAHEGGPPLALAYEEALLAAEEGIITVVDFNEPEPAADADAAAGSSDAAAAGSSDAAADDAEPPERVVPLEEIRLLRPERLMYAKVFRDLWTQGHYVTMGARFGGDFLAYAGDPMRVHAHLIVHVIPSASEMVATELVARAAREHREEDGGARDRRPAEHDGRVSLGGAAQGAWAPPCRPPRRAAPPPPRRAPQRSDRSGSARRGRESHLLRNSYAACTGPHHTHTHTHVVIGGPSRLTPLGEQRGAHHRRRTRRREQAHRGGPPRRAP